MMKDVKALIESQFPGSVLSDLENSSPAGLLIEPSKIKEVCLFLRDDESTHFDMLASVAGVDLGLEENTMEVVYHLYSIPNEQSLVLKCKLTRTNPQIDSVTEIWAAANWHERETYDLLGIQFTGHPDLRRILMPEDWIGHPLRKDYSEQENYHGMSVKYDRDNE